MKQALLKFLSEEAPVDYKPFKARLMGLEPFRLTEDSKAYLEVPCFLNEEDQLKYKKSPGNNAEASIEDWRLERTTNANTQDVGLRLVPGKYTLKKPSGKSKTKANLPDILESEDVQ